MYLWIIGKVGASWLIEHHLKHLVDLLKEALDAYFDKQSQRQEQRKREDFNKALEETSCDQDDHDTYTKPYNK